jgi:magnesium-transporting ATPase (P-type)
VKQSYKNRVEVTVIGQGVTFAVALRYHKAALSRLCLNAHAVICSRVTPSQKAELVGLVKSAGKITLAIGDGGNDVSMIQMAHIGVGIRGKEGLQAARASDFVLPNFRSLRQLLLVHGHYSYVRTALVAQYSFYKSFSFCAIQIAYGFFSLFAGTSLFNSLCVTAYNAVLFVPIVSFIFEKDVPMDAAYTTPLLYARCAKDDRFNWRTVSTWLARGLFQALVVFLMTMASCRLHTTANGMDLNSDYETLGQCCLLLLMMLFLSFFLFISSSPPCMWPCSHVFSLSSLLHVACCMLHVACLLPVLSRFPLSHVACCMSPTTQV